MWAVVEFRGPTPTIGVAHKNWIYGTKCYWPPYWEDKIKLNSALRRGVLPDIQTWASYEIHVIGNKYFASLDEANKKLNLPQTKLDASDLSSAEELTRLRKRTRTPETDGTDSEGSSHDSPLAASKPPKRKKRPYCTQKALIPAPPPPPGADFIPKPSHTLTVVPNVEQVPEGNIQLMSDHIIYQSGTDGILSSVSSPSGPAEALGHHFELVNSQSVNQTNLSLPNNFTAVPVGVPSPHPQVVPTVSSFVTQFPISALAQGQNDNAITDASRLRAIQFEVGLIHSKVDMILQGMSTRPITSSESQITGILALVVEPLQTMDQFNEVEEQLKNPVDYEMMVNWLATIGGNNVNEITHRTVSRIITDLLQNQFSIAGKKNKEGHQKRCFRSTRVFRAICGGVKLHPKGSVGNDKEIEKAVEYWLKRAAKRISKDS